MTHPEPADCPPPADLAAFHRGDLSAAAADAIAAHLEGCPVCEAVLREMDARETSVVADLRRPLPPEDVVSPPADGPGTLLAGRYLLVEPVGEGGMGSVWRARQTAPVRREVAVKLIKPGMDTRQVLARFEAERQALALMDHPNIAKVLEAGTTDRGRPFFVMELVAGVPITRYCDDRRLTPRERLALFVPVCQAVQHAHQKGVIHRDLKPGNILVAEVDGRPVPKVIDFGIAKATEQPLTDRSLATGLGMVVGTPEYMAPEQADPDRQDVDTRADVYALGVLLYELLTGTTPLTRQRAGRAALLEVLRLVREEEPPPPSSRLSTADALPSIAANRGTEPVRLSKLVRGELDWVVMKALEKDRSRRYESAGGFARDVERFLADEPVEAGRPTRWYRLRKFARRHRRPVALAAAAGVLLTAAAGVSTWQAVRATRAEAKTAIARDDAVSERNQKQEALNALVAEQTRTQSALSRATEAERTTQAALKQARDELGTREAVQRFFLEKVLAAGRPKGQAGGLGKDVTLRQAVDAAVPEVAAVFTGRPLAEAAVRTTLGRTYQYLNEFGLAATQLAAAHRLTADALGPEHPEAERAVLLLAPVYTRLNRTDDALQLLEPTLARLTARDHPDRFAAADALAYTCLRAGRAADAVTLLDPLVPEAARRLGETDHIALNMALSLGRAYLQVDRVAEGLALFERVSAHRRANHPPTHPDVLFIDSMLAVAYLQTGRARDSVHILSERVIPARTALLGADAVDTLAAVSHLARAYLDVGRPADAVEALNRVLAGRVKHFDPDHPDTLTARQQLVIAHLAAGRVAEAGPLLDDYLRRVRAKMKPGDPWRGVHLFEVGIALADARQYARAEPVLRESLAIKEATEAGSVPMYDNQSLLGAVLASRGRFAEAEPLLLAGYEGLRRRSHELPAHLRAVPGVAATRLVRLYRAWGEPNEEAKWRAERVKHPAEVAPQPRLSPAGGG